MKAKLTIDWQPIKNISDLKQLDDGIYWFTYLDFDDRRFTDNARVALCILNHDDGDFEIESLNCGVGYISLDYGDRVTHYAPFIVPAPCTDSE